MAGQRIDIIDLKQLIQLKCKWLETDLLNKFFDLGFYSTQLVWYAYTSS